MPSYTIVGRGLAGAVLYEVLRERGIDVRVIDAPKEGSASRAAAGIVNPVVLRRIVPSWRAAQLLPIAERFYQGMEQRYGVKLWHSLPLVKLFHSAREADEWQLKRSDPELSAFLQRAPTEDLDRNSFHAPHGYGLVDHCAWLDVSAFLNAQRERMLREGSLKEVAFSNIEHRISDNETIIHATGPFSDHAGVVPVKGEVLTVQIPGLSSNAIVHRGAFLLPLGGDLFRLGSTFSWDNVWSGPTPQAKTELLDRLSRITALPAEVVDHQVGVRPAARDRRPILGSINGSTHFGSMQGHPQGTLHQFIFNGLGSRGVLLAPWCASHLAGHLLDGTPLDPEVIATRMAGLRT